MHHRCLVLCLAGTWCAPDVVALAAERPNFIVIFVDNLGNGDVRCFGSTLHRTPHIDRMAAEGRRFTSFYVTSGVCTPSRASLLTGCYPRRVNLHVSDKNTAVLQPVSPKGLHPDETTIAELLQSAGYATACIGKWHLGDQLPFLPTRQGFDRCFGIPYSDDMTKDKRPEDWPELPLMIDERVVEAPVDRNLLIQQCTRFAVEFIERHRDRPFFIYLPHTMPGSTSAPFSSPAFRGRSRNGAYGDAVEELDWSAGEILTALKKWQLDERTLVIWTSDNGAVRRDPLQGSCAPYRGFGYSTSEGGMRMPCVMRWPGRIPAGSVCDEICTTLDLLPTFAKLADAALPPRPIDGHDTLALWQGDAELQSPYDRTGFFYYQMGQLQAVRAGPWKLYLPLNEKLINAGRKTAEAPLTLYNVRDDVGESREMAAQHPQIVQRLSGLADRARMELGDNDRPGIGQRSAGWVESPRPLLP
jgi:arylsulfatase A